MSDRGSEPMSPRPPARRPLLWLLGGLVLLGVLIVLIAPELFPFTGA